MATLAELIVKIGADISAFDKEMKNVDKTMKSTGKSLMDVGSSIGDAGQRMALAVSTPLIALGTTAVVIGAKFDAQMSRVKAIAGATGEEFDKLRKQALELGASTAFSSSEVAMAMEELASAGFTVDQILNATAGVLDLAASSGIGLAEAASIAGAAINGFGLEASDAGHVADVLAKAAAISAANATSLGEAFKYVAPVAKTLGLSIEETSAAIGILANAGIDGSSAGTALRMGLLRLASPTKRMSKLMDATGSEFFDASGKMKSMAGIIDVLAEATREMTDEQKAGYLATLFGAEAVSSFMTLIDAGSGKLNEYTKELKNADGEADRMAKTMMDNLAGAWEELTGALESLAIAFSDVVKGDLQRLAIYLTELVNKFEEVPTPMKKAIIYIGLLVAAIAPLLIVTGMLINALGAIITVVGAVSVPIWGVIGAVVALVAIFGTAYAKIDWFREGVNSAFSFIKKHVTEALSTVVSYLKGKFGELREIWERDGNGIRNAAQTTFEFIQKIVSVVMSKTVGLVKDNWQDIKAFLDLIFKQISALIQFWSAVFEGDFDSAWSAIQTLFTSWGKALLALFSLSFLDEMILAGGKAMVKLKDKFNEKMDEIEAAIRVKLEQWWTVMADWFKSLPSRIYAQLSAWQMAIDTWFLEQVTNIYNKLLGWETAIEDWFKSLPSKLKTLFLTWETAITEWFKSLPSKIKTLLLSWGNAITDWTKAQHEENKRQFSEWGKAIVDWFKSIPQKIKAELKSWRTAIEEHFKSKLESGQKMLEQYGKMLVDFYGSIPEKIKGRLDVWKKVVTDWYKDLKENAPKKLEEWWKSMQEWFKSIPKKIEAALEDWWKSIQKWFKGLKDKPEVKNAGKEMVDKVSEGNKEKKQEFMDKLGKLIVDVITAALAFAAVALIAAGRELIKRIISGVDQTKTNLETSAKNAISAFINGVSSKLGDVARKAVELKDRFLKPIKDLKADVDTWIGRIVGAFANMKITVPKPRLPKVNVGSAKKSLFGVSFDVPTFSVDWNAKGGIFNGASILGGGQGVGERGAEAVLPIQHKRYMAPFARAVADHMEPNRDDKVIVVENYNETSVILDDEVVGRKVEKTVSRQQMDKLKRKRRR